MCPPILLTKKIVEKIHFLTCIVLCKITDLRDKHCGNDSVHYLNSQRNLHWGQAGSQEYIIVYCVYSVAQLRPNWAKKSAWLQFLIVHSTAVFRGFWFYKRSGTKWTNRWKIWYTYVWTNRWNSWRKPMQSWPRWEDKHC